MLLSLNDLFIGDLYPSCQCMYVSAVFVISELESSGLHLT